MDDDGGYFFYSPAMNLQKLPDLVILSLFNARSFGFLVIFAVIIHNSMPYGRANS